MAMGHDKGLGSGVAIAKAMEAYPPSALPRTPAGRMQWIMDILGGIPIYDADGNDTGERTEPLISMEQAAQLWESI